MEGRFPPKVVPLEAVFVVILWQYTKNPPEEGKLKGATKNPFSLPTLLGKRKMPYGGRERNFYKATSDLSSSKLEQIVFSIWLCVNLQ